MSDAPDLAALKLRVQELAKEPKGSSSQISVNEFLHLASDYIRISERFNKVLEISDKYHELVRSVNLNEFGAPRRRPPVSSGELEGKMQEILTRLEGSADQDAKTLARQYRKLHSQLSKIMAISDVYQSQLRDTTLRLELMARTDMLTELSNRRDMSERLVMESARSTRNKQPYGIAIFDIDDFKRVNDTYGHEAGDRVLVMVAATLRENLRASDVCARWGGEEFLVLCPETTLEQVTAVAEKCRQAVESAESIESGGKRLRVTVSGGVSSGSAEDWESLVREADTALYEAKAQGKNQVVQPHYSRGDDGETM